MECKKHDPYVYFYTSSIVKTNFNDICENNIIFDINGNLDPDYQYDLLINRYIGSICIKKTMM